MIGLFSMQKSIRSKITFQFFIRRNVLLLKFDGIKIVVKFNSSILIDFN